MKMSLIVCLILSVVSTLSSSLTLIWNPNTEPDVNQYRAYRSVNGGGFVGSPFVNAPATSNTWSDIQLGNSYQFYVTALNTNQLESLPSAVLSFTPSPLPPAINVQKVVIGGAIGVSVWTGVQVFFDTVNLASYGATNYIITATGTTGAPVVTSATNSPVTIPPLSVQNYTFSAVVVGNSGNSPTGGTVSISGTRPVAPAGVHTQTGP